MRRPGSGSWPGLGALVCHLQGGTDRGPHHLCAAMDMRTWGSRWEQQGWTHRGRGSRGPRPWAHRCLFPSVIFAKGYIFLLPLQGPTHTHTHTHPRWHSRKTANKRIESKLQESGALLRPRPGLGPLLVQSPHVSVTCTTTKPLGVSARRAERSTVQDAAQNPKAGGGMLFGD